MLHNCMCSLKLKSTKSQLSLKNRAMFVLALCRFFYEEAESISYL